MKTFRVINLSNTVDAEGNYEVNDAHFTGDTVDLPPNPTKEQIGLALKAEGAMHPNAADNAWMIDETSNETSIYIRETDGKWLWELRAAV